MDRSRIERLEWLYSQNQGDPVIGFGLGVALVENGEPAKGRVILENVIRQKPEYAAAWEWLGKALEDLGEREEAIRVYRKGIEISRSGGFLAPEKQMFRRLKRLGAVPAVSSEKERKDE